MTGAKKSIMFVVFVSITLLTYLNIFNSNILPEEKLLPPPRIVLRSINSNTKYILYFTKMFDRTDFYMGLGKDIFKNCPVNNCLTTSNRTLMPIEKYDALLFHTVEFNPNTTIDKPKRRSANQVYIFAGLESPMNTPNFGLMKPYFNWTMTYRLDSDIVWSYGSFSKRKTGYIPPTPKEIQNRPKNITWFVSHCNVQSKRDSLAKKLNKYIDIEVFGKCNNHTCKGSEDCYATMDETYKFYLSFENSICKDYVTEKLFNVLQKNIVPIVYGGANYSLLAPPNSVIDASEFETAKELANYLHKLIEDPVEYLKYFEWKKNYVVNSNLTGVLCDLCRKLHEPLRPQIYDDVNFWFRKHKCKGTKDLPRIVFRN